MTFSMRTTGQIAIGMLVLLGLTLDASAARKKGKKKKRAAALAIPLFTAAPTPLNFNMYGAKNIENLCTNAEGGFHLTVNFFNGEDYEIEINGNNEKLYSLEGTKKIPATYTLTLGAQRFTVDFDKNSSYNIKLSTDYFRDMLAAQNGLDIDDVKQSAHQSVEIVAQSMNTNGYVHDPEQRLVVKVVGPAAPDVSSDEGYVSNDDESGVESSHAQDSANADVGAGVGAGEAFWQ